MPRPKKFNSKKFLWEAGRISAVRVRARAAIKVKSTQLRQALALKQYKTTKNQSQWAVYIPHYWAVYYHDGRRPVKAKKGKRMVFFKNPKDDPRHHGKYPERLKQKRSLRLSKQEFRRLRPKMVIARKVKGTTGEFFFDNRFGMAGILTPVGNEISGLFSEHVKDFLGKDLRIKETLNVRF